MNSTNMTFEIWLTRKEQDNVCIRTQILPMLLRAKSQGLFPVILCSGQNSLINNTKELIKQNRTSLVDKNSISEKSLSIKQK